MIGPSGQSNGLRREAFVGLGAIVVAITVVTATIVLTRGDRRPTASLPVASNASGQTAPRGAPPAVWAVLTWTVGDPSPFDYPGVTYVTDAIWWGDAFLAVGYTIDEARVSGRIWSSPDGLAWQLEPVERPDLVFDRIFVVGEGVAIIGAHRAPDVGEEAGATSLGLWTSTDGRTWAESVLPDELLGHQHIRAVAAGSAGWLIHTNDLVGGKQRWITGDQRGSWRLADVGSTFGGGDVFLTASEAGWFAFGTRGVDPAGVQAGDPADDRGAIWLSSDAEHWEAASINRPGTGVHQIVRVAGGWIALGTDHEGCRRCIDHTMLAWRSNDGRIWSPIEIGQSEMNRFGGLVLSSDGNRAIAIDTVAERVRVREITDGRTFRVIPNGFDVSVGTTDLPDFSRPYIGPMGVVAFDQVAHKEEPVRHYVVPYLGAAGGPPSP
ncbi:MAG TPA: hypothetical protein VEO91_06070 [Candidatus Limnocylindria bacterium]|nr:hypothetical protein [Candidatus Limnocylindria bacterium]